MPKYIKIRASKAQRFIILACLTIAIGAHQLDAFWLTDGSLLFQQPAAVTLENRIKDEQLIQSSVQQDVVQRANQNETITIEQGGGGLRTANSSGSNSSEPLASNPRPDSKSWVRLQVGTTASKTPGPSKKQADNKQDEQGSASNCVTNMAAAGAEGTPVAPVCQCNPDWLQSQASSLMGRWMNSSNFADQVRAQVLAVAATANTVPTPRAKTNQQQQQQARHVSNGPGGRPGLAWNRQTSKRNSAGNGGMGGGNHGPGGGSSSRPGIHRAPGGGGSTGKWQPNTTNTGRNHRGTSDLQQAAAAQVKLVQGERGPKGEQGARGERGPSGLIAVKDRGALFDLSSPIVTETGNAATGSQAQQRANYKSDQQQQSTSGESGAKEPSMSAANTSAPRLVFVESEQLLVIETSSGWRPIPLLAPLYDFRKTIAKFNIGGGAGGSLSAPPNDWKQLKQAAHGGGNQHALMELYDKIITSEIGAAISKPNRMSSASSSSNSSHVVPVASLNAIESRDTQLAMSNLITEAVGRGGGAPRPGKMGPNGVGINMDEEDDDDDDNDDDDGSDEDEYDDDKEDDDDDEHIGGGVNADDDQQQYKARMANTIDGKIVKMAGAAGKLGSLASVMEEVVSGSVMDKTKRRRAQVSGRSALAPPPPSASETRSGASNVATQQAGAISTVNDDRGDGYDASSSSSQSNLMKLRLIALNEPYSGSQHGLRGANFECKRNAARAGIRGAFRAFLATGYQNLDEIVRHNSHVQKYPIVNMRGDILAASWHDLFKSPARTANPLSRLYSFDGRHVASDPNWPNKLIWLGTSSKVGGRDSTGHNCDGWHSDSLNRLGYASPLHSPKGHHHYHNHSNHHQQQQQQLLNQQDHHQSQHPGASRRRTQQRRFVVGSSGTPTITTKDDGSQATNQNATMTAGVGSNLVFDVLEKYPCRMPLVVLCIETIAQGE